MPNQKYTFGAYKFLKLVTGLANAGHDTKRFTTTPLRFKEMEC